MQLLFAEYSLNYSLIFILLNTFFEKNRSDYIIVAINEIT
ncbi:hypothetical protein CLV25_10325 [Acetobacteroides hydrogenigenes]|uniref:Uncharacterized protein n=1 Tax=Acetobacteroides hydrogenigenes TaxID=979970 RepID=A0A4V6NM13_9BACT|nr:hypothetical protein CLV25_10325 [Acetobacteroides hydrogenigenes]